MAWHEKRQSNENRTNTAAAEDVLLICQSCFGPLRETDLIGGNTFLNGALTTEKLFHNEEDMNFLLLWSTCITHIMFSKTIQLMIIHFALLVGCLLSTRGVCLKLSFAAFRLCSVQISGWLGNGCRHHLIHNLFLFTFNNKCLKHRGLIAIVWSTGKYQVPCKHCLMYVSITK